MRTIENLLRSGRIGRIARATDRIDNTRSGLKPHYIQRKIVGKEKKLTPKGADGPKVPGFATRQLRPEKKDGFTRRPNTQ
jgi:hypothetical protein